ncbi:MAG: hypothetical protein R3B09_09055 [Nannocystaceae bacterium]
MDSTERLARLGDELRRAQEVLGVAPVEPARPVYPQHHEPRLVEARARLHELGYAGERGDAELLGRFRREAGLRGPASGRLGLDGPVWRALEELRGEVEAIDPRRWRGRDREWLPAMRRAIDARSVDLGVRGGSPHAFADLDDDDAPPTEGEADDALRRFAGLVEIDPGDGDATLALLFDDAALLDRTRGAADALSFAGDDGLADLQDRLLRRELATLDLDDDDEAGRRGARLAALRDGDDDLDDDLADDAPLAFGLDREGRDLGRLFHDLAAEPSYRVAPGPAAARSHLVSITAALAEAVDDVDERWSEFLADARGVWRGAPRSRSWIHGAATWFEARGDDLEGGLRRILAGGRGLARRRQSDDARAATATTLRVTYHSLADVFDGAHRALATLVDFIDGPADQGSIRIVRRADDVRVVVASTAAATELDAFIGQLRRRDRRLVAAAELVGLLLGLVGRWAGGPLGVSTALFSLLGAAPRILALAEALDDEG